MVVTLMEQSRTGHAQSVYIASGFFSYAKVTLKIRKAKFQTNHRQICAFSKAMTLRWVTFLAILCHRWSVRCGLYTPDLIGSNRIMKTLCICILVLCDRHMVCAFACMCGGQRATLGIIH